MKPKRIVKIETIEFSDYMNILNVSSMERLTELQEDNDLLVETPNDMFLFKEGNVVFRFIKKEAMPQILHAKNFWLNPDSYRTKVELSAEELLDMAKKERIPLFETSTEFIAPADIVLFAQKTKPLQKEG